MAKKCPNCGKNVPEFHNTCGEYDCAIDSAKKAGGKVIAPNDLPIVCIRHDHAMLEDEHATHRHYKFPVEARFHLTPQELFDEGESFWVDGNGDKTKMSVEDLEYDCVQTHALIYKDGGVAVTLYECCYAMWHLYDGKVAGGSLWEKGHWVLTPESRAKIKEYTVTDNIVKRVVNRVRAAQETNETPTWVKGLQALDLQGRDELYTDLITQEIPFWVDIVAGGSTVDVDEVQFFVKRRGFNASETRKFQALADFLNKHATDIRATHGKKDTDG
jgi:hypothetical protein